MPQIPHQNAKNRYSHGYRVMIARGEHAMPAPHACSQCDAKYYAKDLCARCYQAKQRQEHPEYRRVLQRTYREKHRGQTCAWSRSYYQRHREAEIARVTAYRATHRDEINARQRAYRLAKKQQSPA